ncbi:replicative DNA helicase [Kineococcus sp. T13]|uniref:replicative DNA helicase n=1 Tax=Kineococcus vitellinus TaxID=2696565 RepID=UPI00141240BF|nr:replicative DNA helicase [Kineococcus vitellinus]NAZ76428.1 replicative DNA helicase [Kineococcus vitellinus]
MPPQDIAAEQGVLGGMMLSKDAIADVVEVLKGNDFYRPAHELIYEAVLDLYSRGEPADPVTVSAELTNRNELARVGGTPYLHDLISTVPTAANAGFYARIVRERAVLRRLVEAGTRIVQMGYGGDGMDVEAIVNSAQAEVYAVTEKRVKEDYAVLGDVIEGTIDEIEASSHRGEGMVGVPTGFADLDQLTNGLHPGQMIVIAARPAVGKALALDTPLPTPGGWTTMGRVQVGDELLGADGRPTRVVAATDVLLDRPCYEVRFSDGSSIVADAQHQWLTSTRASRKSAHAAATGYDRTKNQRTFPSVKTTEEIAGTVRCGGAEQRLNHAVALAAPLELPEQDHLVPAYVLGAWLGDGTSASAQITTADPELVVHLEDEGLVVVPRGGMSYSLRLPTPVIATRGCVVCGREFTPRTSEVKTCGRSCGGRSRGAGAPRQEPTCPDCGRPSSGLVLCQQCRDHHGTLQARLRTIGVLGDKHVPAAYLRGSLAQRRALLAGLLDTDGTVAPSGTVQFSVTSRRLAEGVRELVHSLGYRTGWSEKRVDGRSAASSTAYTITFSTDDDVFRLERKRIAHKDRRQRRFTRRDSRFITEVRRIDPVPVRCVEVSNDDHLYLAGRSMIPTHNSTLGLDIARAASIKHGLASVIFSLEMGRNEISMRLLSAEARIPLQNMRKGTMREDDWTKLARTMGSVSEAPLYIDDSPNMSLMEIRSKCRRLKQRADLKLVIVDYLQLMTSGKRVESRQQEVSEFSRALKLLAKEIEVPVIALSQLNRGPEQRTDKKPQMSDLRESGCLTADTRVLRADTGAETTMGELFALQARDVPVWALDDSLRYVRRHLTHVFPTGVKPVHRLRLASGKEVRATANHPFLTYDGWKPLGELGVADRIAVPRHVPGPERVAGWEDDRVVLLGHLIGDGSFARRQPLRYASVDEANLSAVADAAASAFGITAVRDEHAAARCTTLRLPAPLRLTHGKRNPIAEWLDDLGLFGRRSHEKFVPEEVFHLPKRQIALFLRHLWATDGSVTVSRAGRGGRIYYASTSRRLVDDLSRLLLRFGISTRVRTATPKPGYRPGYTLDVSGVDDQRRFLQEIGVHGARGASADRLLEVVRDVSGNTNVDTVPRQVWDDVRQLLQERGMTHREFAAAMGTSFSGSTLWKHAPSRERLGRVAQVLDSADLEVMAVNDVLWDEVVAIDPDGEEQVFDATVAGGHNFIADGIAVHNSIEQDADMVILLHREDMYEKESPRAGEADFIVAKHRNGPTDTITVAFQGHYSRFVDMAT